MKSIRQILREQTGPLHRSLDEIVGRCPPFESEANYEIYLRSMQQLYRTFQSVLDWTADQARLPQAAQLVVACIDDDVASMNVDVPPLEAAALEIDGFSESQKWGIAYVMEGSSMGASFMIRIASEKLPAPIGTKFLERLASDSKNRWPEFISALDASGCEENDAINGANIAFQKAAEFFEATQQSRSGASSS